MNESMFYWMRLTNATVNLLVAYVILAKAWLVWRKSYWHLRLHIWLYGPMEGDDA